MYIIIAILIFGILIAVHEMGHFIAAKLCKVRVSEFAIGMGPALFKRQKGETLYALRAFPIGGYCAMGEDDDAVEAHDDSAFVNKKWWQKFIILVAGAGMNFLVGFLILLIIVPGSQSFQSPIITDFFDGCPYEKTDGFQEGDEIYKIDGQRIYFSSNIGLYLSRGDDSVYDIELIRNGEKLLLEDYNLSLVEYTVDGETVEKYGLYFGVKEEGFVAGVRDSWYCALDFVRMVWMGLSDLVTGAIGLNELSGPVGIVGLFNDVGQAAPTVSAAAFSMSYLAAFIAINLGVMNLLPIPALDGGRIFFLLVGTVVEKITKKKLNPKYEGYIHATGMVLLLVLTAFVLFSDVVKLIM